MYGYLIGILGPPSSASTLQASLQAIADEDHSPNPTILKKRWVSGISPVRYVHAYFWITVLVPPTTRGLTGSI